MRARSIATCARSAVFRLLPRRAALAALALFVVACAPDEPLAGTPVMQVGGAVGAVAVEGERAWLGTGRRVQGVDVADPARPEPLGQSDALPETIRSLVADSDARAVFAAAGASGLFVLDVSDPEGPHIVAHEPTGWTVNDVALEGTADGLRAYLAEGAEGIRVLDVSDPAVPVTLGSVDTPGDALAVVADDGVVYVADWGTGVRIIDVSDAAAPHEIASIDTPGEAADVAIGEHGLLLVADRTGGLRLIDVSDPSQPTEVAHLALPGAAERLASDGDRVYVAAADGGLAVVDVSAPRSPQLLGQLEDVTVAMDVVAEHGHGGDGLVFVADVGAPVPQPRTSKSDLWSGMHMWGVKGRPEVAAGLAGLHIAQATTDGLVPIGMYLSPSLIESLAVDDSGEVLFLADGHAGVVVLEVSHPSSPRLVGSLRTPGVSHDVIVDGDRALVAAGPAGLVVLDIDDPLSPRIAAVIDTPDEALGAAMLGETAYVADGEAGLRVIDLASGSEVGHVDTPGYAWDVLVIGAPSHAAGAKAAEAIGTAADISAAGSPTAGGPPASRPRAGGAYAYVSDRPGGMRVYDLADPLRPRQVAVVLDGQGDVLDVALDGELAWVAAGPSGVRAFDVSDPLAPRSVGRVLIDDRAIGIVVDGDSLYVAAGDSGLLEMNIEDPPLARVSGVWGMPGAAERLVRMGDWVYVAAESGGLQLVQLGN